MGSIVASYWSVGHFVHPLTNCVFQSFQLIVNTVNGQTLVCAVDHVVKEPTPDTGMSRLHLSDHCDCVIVKNFDDRLYNGYQCGITLFIFYSVNVSD